MIALSSVNIAQSSRGSSILANLSRAVELERKSGQFHHQIMQQSVCRRGTSPACGVGSKKTIEIVVG